MKLLQLAAATEFINRWSNEVLEFNSSLPHDVMYKINQFIKR